MTFESDAVIVTQQRGDMSIHLPPGFAGQRRAIEVKVENRANIGSSRFTRFLSSSLCLLLRLACGSLLSSLLSSRGSRGSRRFCFFGFVAGTCREKQRSKNYT